MESLLAVAGPDSGIYCWLSSCLVYFSVKSLLAVAGPDTGVSRWLSSYLVYFSSVCL